MMMSGQMRRAIFLSLIVATVSCSAWAQEKPDSFSEAPYGADKSEIAEALKDCKNASGEKTVQICAWDHYRRVEMVYRQATKDAGQAIAAEDGPALAKANRAFEQFRSATCDFDLRGAGSMAGSLLYGCLADYTQRRARALRVFAKCEKTGNCELPNLLYIHENEEPIQSNKK